MAFFHLSSIDLLVRFLCIHPLQSCDLGNPPARGWHSVVLLGSTYFPRGKVYMQDQLVRKFKMDTQHIDKHCNIVFWLVT